MGRRGLGQLVGGSDINLGHEASDALSPLGEAIPWAQSSISAFAPDNFMSKHLAMTLSALTTRCSLPDLAAVIR